MIIVNKLLVESGFILLNWNRCRFDIGTVGEEDYAGLTCGNGKHNKDSNLVGHEDRGGKVV